MELRLLVHDDVQLSESTRLSNLIGTEGILFSTIVKIVRKAALTRDVQRDLS